MFTISKGFAVISATKNLQLPFREDIFASGRTRFLEWVVSENQKGEHPTYISNWQAMHQYKKKGGVYVNEAAEAKGKNMTAELEKVKEQLASSAPNDTPPYQIMVPEKLQLGILSAELGVGKDKKIRGVGSSLRVQGTSRRISESNATNTSYDSKHKVDELSGKVDKLLGVIQKMQAHIKYLCKKGKKNHDNDDDDDSGDNFDDEDGVEVGHDFDDEYGDIGVANYVMFISYGWVGCTYFICFL